MILRKIFYALFVSTMLMSLNSCELENPSDDSSIVEDIKFVLREDLVDLSSASIRVRHNGPSEVMWVYMYTEDFDTDPNQLIEDRVNNEYDFTEQIVAHQGNNKSLHIKGLEAKKRYRVIVKAIGKDGKLYGSAASFDFKTRRNPDLWEVNENWSLTRSAERSEAAIPGTDKVQQYENFVCTSKDQENYFVLTLSKEDFQAYEKDDDHKDVKRTLFEDYYKYFTSESDYKSRVMTGDKVWKEERLRSGDYVLFMIGLDEEYELSGLYKQFNITIEPEQPTENYNKWLGWWQISFSDGSNPWNIYVDDLDPNMWYLSLGWEPEAISADVYNMGLKLYYDNSTGKMYLVSQEVASADNGTKVYYYGTFKYGISNIVLDYDNVRLASADFTNLAATEAQINAEGMYLTGVGDITFTYSLFYLRYSSTSAIAASGSIPGFPWTMKKIDDPSANL
jgi:hypothetical protein